MLSTYSNLNPRWLLLGEGEMKELTINKPKEAIRQYPNTTEISKSSQAIERMDNTIVSNQTAEKLDKPDPIINQAPQPNDQILDIHEIVSKNIDNKDIESIVVFFRDKTFTAYSPSK